MRLGQRPKAKGQSWRSRARFTNDRGFTLVEVLVSVALIAVCAVPMLQLFTSSAMSSASGRYTTMATAVANATLEEVRAGTYRDASGKLANGSQTLSALPTYPDFTRQLVISDDSTSGCKKVTAKVSWARGSGSSSIQVTTLIN